MGMELVGLMLVSAYFGNILDKSYKTGGLILAGLCMVSLVGWLTQIILLAKKLEKTEEDSLLESTPPSTLDDSISENKKKGDLN